MRRAKLAEKLVYILYGAAMIWFWAGLDSPKRRNKYFRSMFLGIRYGEYRYDIGCLILWEMPKESMMVGVSQTSIDIQSTVEMLA